MSLVADYGSDSDSDTQETTEKKTLPVAATPSLTFTPTITAPVAASVEENKKETVKPKRPRKKKKTILLPPEIQKLLESGQTLNSDDDSGDDKKKSTQTKKTAQLRSNQDKKDALSFLPPPKVQLQVLPSSKPAPIEKNEVKAKSDEEEVAGHQSEYAAQTHAHAHAHAYAPQEQQAEYMSNYSFDEEHAAEDYGNGKRKRNNQRELERLLQQGKFDAIAGNITEIKATAPDAWQPPIDSRGYAHDREAKVMASLAGTETEAGYVVASARPTRLQRQRHQLNQLTFDAKLKEYEFMDSRAQMARSKKETAAKYGW